MGASSKIQEAVRILANGVNHSAPVFSADCEVISVDLAERTATVRAIDGKASNTFTARIMATVDDGVLLEPEIGSTVSVIGGNFTDPYISQYSAVKSIILRGGDLGGLVKIAPLLEKINKLEELVNDLVTKYNLHTHASSGVPPAVPETGSLVPTTRPELENENIKQG